MKSIRRIVLLIAVFSFLNSTAQQNFQRLLGGSDADRAQTIFGFSTGGYVVNGASLSFGAGNADAVLVRLNDQGMVIWSKAYGTSEYDNSEFAIETTDHNLVCAGRSNISTGLPTAAVIFKTDSSGQLLWSKQYGGANNDGFVNIIETSDNGFAAVGNTSSISAGGSDILLVKTDMHGDTIFTQAYGTIEDEAGFSVIQLPDDGFLVTGRQTTYPGGSPRADGLLLRTDASGNLLWTKQYGDSLWEELTAAQLLPDGGFIITGSTVTFGAGTYDILLMRTDSAGGIIWSKTFGGTATDAAYDIHLTPEGNYVLSGYTESFGYGHRGGDSANVFLMKTDTSGGLIWMQAYGDGLQDEAFRSSVVADGGYVVSGFTKNYLLGDSAQMFVAKTDTAGSSGCHELSVTPVENIILMPDTSIVLNQSSGMPVSSAGFVENVVSMSEDDACLFAAIERYDRNDWVRAFPNPFSGQLRIEVSEAPTKLKIYDAIGKVVYTGENIGQSFTLDLNDLNAGVYLVHIISADKQDVLPVIKK